MGGSEWKESHVCKVSTKQELNEFDQFHETIFPCKVE